MISRRRFYDTKGHQYEQGRYGDPHMDRYRDFRNDSLVEILRAKFGDRPLRILEVGCGTGLSLAYLAKSASKHQLFGIDASETMLAQAATKTFSGENRPRLVLGDAGRLPYGDGLFDAVFATRFIHQFTHQTKLELWRECHRVVRPGGVLIMEFYALPYHWLRYFLGARKGRSKNAYFCHYPSMGEVREIVGEGLEIYPLRLPGSRLLAGVFGDNAMRRLTNMAGHVAGTFLLDEYFVVARAQ